MQKELRTKAKKLCREYIKLRDCLTSTGTLGHGRCTTCSKIHPINELQQGHFVHTQSRYIKLTYDERNIHIQCAECNTFKGGNMAEYEKFMYNFYGEEVVNGLKLDRDRQKQLTFDEYEEIIEDFKKKIETIKKAERMLT